MNNRIDLKESGGAWGYRTIDSWAVRVVRQNGGLGMDLKDLAEVRVDRQEQRTTSVENCLNFR
jgi:hypothetical protein